MIDDVQRLDELHRYELFDGDSDPGLDRLTELAARICETPIAALTFVSDTHQRFVSRWGVPAWVGTQTSIDASLCRFAIERPETMTIMENTLDDPRARDNPMVLGDLGVRFYAGAPLVTPRGHALGTVCVVDRRARTLTPEQARGLALVRDEAMELLDARRELTELRRSEALRQEAVEALVVMQHDLRRSG